MIDLEELKSMMQKPASTNNPEKPSDSVPAFELDDDGEEYMPVGIDGVLASTEKLLAINRGLVDQDERDSLRFQKVFRPHSMLRESIKMDAGKTARTAMYQAAKRRNLKGVNPFMFDSYVERLLVGNPLTSPLEEINPMQLVENARRVTKMGPGGLNSSRSITEASQNVHPSQFGFISPIEGPECWVSLSGSVVYAKTGWVAIEDITLDTELACLIDGHLEFHKPERVIHEPYKGTVYGVRNGNISFLVTPGHRLYGNFLKSAKKKFVTAEEAYRRIMQLPCRHDPYPGNDIQTFSPDGEHQYSTQDWCSLLGWFLSEGNVTTTTKYLSPVCITQSEDIHPDEFAEIDALLRRMNLKFSYRKPGNDDPRGYTKKLGFTITEPCIKQWFVQYKHGCYHKWIPEEIFDWPISARQALLDSLMKGDGRINKTHATYCTVSKKLADDVERLAIGLGWCVRRNIEKDNRPHVKTTNYAVCLLKSRTRATETNDKRYHPYWYKGEFDGIVHCAKVPGGMLYYSAEGRPGCWFGNSERAGIDVRVAWGAKLGSNGRLYQKFYDRRKKRFRWLSPEDLDGLTVKIPD